MVAIDLTVVATALPAISDFFHAAPADTLWVVLAYALPASSLMIAAGRWVDRIDPRGAFALGVLGFAASSAAAGAAPSLEILLGARLIQGAFGALLSALVLAIVGPVVRPDERGKAFGVIGTLGPLGSTAGPALGGVLVAAAGWRWIFYINVPVSLLAATLGWRSIPARGRLTRPSPALLLDAGVASLAALGLLGGLYAAASSGWAEPATLVAFVVALAAAALWLRLRTTRPVIAALRAPALSGQLAALLIATTGVGAIYFLFPFLLQDVLGRPVQEAGAVLLALPLTLAVASQVGGRAADRFGPRITSIVGLFTVLVGAASLLTLTSSATSTDIAWRLGVVGLGSGLFVAPNSSAVIAASPRDLLGTVSGLSGLARNLGFALGPPLAALLWVARAFSLEAMRPVVVMIAVLPAAALLTVLATPREQQAEEGATSRRTAA